MAGRNTGFTRIFKATYYSFKGFRAALVHEAAFRQEVVAALVLIPLAFYLANSALERVLLVASVVLVLIVELLNSGIEAVVDRVGMEHNELAGRAKDMGSAAVLVSLLLWIFIWGSLLLPRWG